MRRAIAVRLFCFFYGKCAKIYKDFTFIPYNDRNIEYLIGWDANGNEVMLDAVIPPDFPVIVIGENERLTLPPNISGFLSAPTNLVGRVASGGIHLSWTAVPEIHAAFFGGGYELWVKPAGQADFELRAVLNGASNTTFFDNANYDIGTFVDFKVRGFMIRSVNMITGDQTIIRSAFSNVYTVATPGMPAGMATFNATQNALNSVWLRWTLSPDPNQAIGRKIISRNIDGVDNAFREIGTVDRNTFSFFDRDFPPGRRVRYKVQVESPNGNLSNPTRDFIYSTYRDPSIFTAVRIRRVELTEGNPDGWLRGSPEFVMSALMVNRVGGHNTPIIIQSNIRLDFPGCFLGIGCRNHANFNVPILTHWRPGFFYDMLTFHMIESNRNRESNFDLSAQFNIRNTETEGLDTGLTSTIRVTYRHEGTDFGNAHYSYFDPTEFWLYFRDGVRVLLSASAE